METALSLYLLLPIGLSILYGYTESLCMVKLGYSGQSEAKWLLVFITMAGAVLLWSVTECQLPIFYGYNYLLWIVRYTYKNKDSKKSMFLLNISYVNMMALHLIIIGVASLSQKITMYELLTKSTWRVYTISAVIFICILEDLFFLRNKKFSLSIATEAESEEGQAFMGFLWFCTGCLLIDSLLCIVKLEPFYPPLFLVGSSLILMFLLIRFLVNINAILYNNNLKLEYDHLAKKLEKIEYNSAALRQLADYDPLTRAYSRRYAKEQIAKLMDTGKEFSLIYLDMDGLKRLNDREGHDAGDRYLIDFANMVKGAIREKDILARMGGDEFVLLMPDCDKNTASARIEDIRCQMKAKGNENTTFCFSYGVSSYHTGERKSGEELLKEADQAMYMDKNKNR